MAVFYANSFESEPDTKEWLFGRVADELSCFLCHQELSFPLIMWAGATSDVFFHEPCATSFILRLAIDCRELEKNRVSGAITEGGGLKGGK